MAPDSGHSPAAISDAAGVAVRLQVAKLRVAALHRPAAELSATAAGVRASASRLPADRKRSGPARSQGAQVRWKQFESIQLSHLTLLRKLPTSPPPPPIA